MKFKYVKAILIIALLLLASVALSQPDLPNFPQTWTDYTYHIDLPQGTTAIAIFWYYGLEANTHMVYQSGHKRIRCCRVRTEMAFSRPGVYILTIWYERDGKVDAMRRKYTVRHSWRSQLRTGKELITLV